MYIYYQSKGDMVKKAKLFKNGHSQAVRLPKEFRLPGTEVGVRKVGKAVLLVPLEHGWDSLFESLAEFSDDFLAERTQASPQPREKAFQ